MGAVASGCKGVMREPRIAPNNKFPLEFSNLETYFGSNNEIYMNLEEF